MYPRGALWRRLCPLMPLIDDRLHIHIEYALSKYLKSIVNTEKKTVSSPSLFRTPSPHYIMLPTLFE